MATVYLAEDLKQHRRVAVKVLRSDLAQTLGADRFLREIEIAANLHHPHILPLYESGAIVAPPPEVGGGPGGPATLYYVMPLHRRRVSPRPPRARETVPARRRAPHHPRDRPTHSATLTENGVIHRDIKPENILLQSGHAIVTDFGIARGGHLGVGRTDWAHRYRARGGHPRLYESGASIGGEGSRRPERHLQPRLRAVEMLAGQPPFGGATPQVLIRQHLTTPAPPVTSSVRQFPTLSPRH